MKNEQYLAMNLNLTLKITFTILILITLTLTMISLLSYFKYEKTLNSIIVSRTEVIIIDLKNTAEISLNIGLSLAENENIQAVIDRVKQQDSQILQIDIFNKKGLVLFSTSPEQINRTVPASWLIDNQSKSPKKPWDISDDTVFNLRADLVNNSFNQVMGGISLQTSKDYLRDKMQEMFYNLIKNFLIVLTALALVTMLAVFLLFRPTSNSFNKMNQALANLLSSKPDNSDKTETTTAFIPKNELEQHCYRFHAQAQHALLELQAAHQNNEPTPHSDKCDEKSH